MLQKIFGEQGFIQLKTICTLNFEFKETNGVFTIFVNLGTFSTNETHRLEFP